MYTEEELDFAYRYPFSEEGRNIIKGMNLSSIDRRHLLIGKNRLEHALSGELKFTETSYMRLDYILGYVYARMLLSAMKRQYLITIFADSEARRATEALRGGPQANLMKVSRELGLGMALAKDGTMEMSVSEFLRYASAREDSPYKLASQRLSKGVVNMDSATAAGVVGFAIAKHVVKGLPIPQKELPKAVIEESKEVRIAPSALQPALGMPTGSRVTYWIERLMQTPIPDCRHRTVNLILAPYLVNVKGISPEKASSMIMDYINKCKTIEPHTNITDRYIQYQCNYAKNKGIRPMSLRRAKTELSAIDFKLLGVDDGDKE
jgi:hypothetical protein